MFMFTAFKRGSRCTWLSRQLQGNTTSMEYKCKITCTLWQKGKTRIKDTIIDSSFSKSRNGEHWRPRRHDPTPWVANFFHRNCTEDVPTAMCGEFGHGAVGLYGAGQLYVGSNSNLYKKKSRMWHGPGHQSATLPGCWPTCASLGAFQERSRVSSSPYGTASSCVPRKNACP